MELLKKKLATAEKAGNQAAIKEIKSDIAKLKEKITLYSSNKKQ